MARELVRIAAGGPDSTLVAELDAGLAARPRSCAWSSASDRPGRLGLTLYAVRPGDAAAVELLTIPGAGVGSAVSVRLWSLIRTPRLQAWV